MKVKLLTEDAIAPTKATEFAAGYDLYSVEDRMLLQNQIDVIKTGIALEIPFGCVGMIKGRSSLGAKGIDVLGGIIDCDYRGEIKVILSMQVGAYKILKGEKIAQILIIPLAPIKSHIEVVDQLTETERGEKGFGSSNVVLRQPYSEQDFSTMHMSVHGVTTICEKSVNEVGYYTSNLNDVTCEICKKGSKVNYG